MNYYEALSFLESTNVFGSKLGLENISYLLNLLNNPHQNLKVIHVAGTNGKGSTCAYVSNILIDCGYKTGLYISPSLEEINDRISINGKYISDDDFCQLAGEVKNAIDIMVKKGYQHPTEFEVVTAMAFLHYHRQNVDYVVMEVGLGGRLDATNVCNPIITAITSISFDHTDYLGDTLPKIAFEKAGIIKENIPLVLYHQDKAVMDKVMEVAKEKCAKVYLNSEVKCNITKQEINYQSMEVEFDREIVKVRSHLVGAHQRDNLKTAIKIIKLIRDLEKLNITRENIVSGIENTRWAGRFEYIKHTPTIILDGAHNLDGAKVLKDNLDKTLKDKTITLVFGMLADKDIKNVVKTFGNIFSKVIITVPNSPRAEDPQKISKEFGDCGIDSVIEPSIKKALELGLDSKTDIVLIAGSLYLIGDVRKYLREKEIIKCQIQS